MGNTIKNYEKKRRRKYKEDCREIDRLVYGAIIKKCPIPEKLKEEAFEVFDVLNKDLER